ITTETERVPARARVPNAKRRLAAAVARFLVRAREESFGQATGEQAARVPAAQRIGPPDTVDEEPAQCREAQGRSDPRRRTPQAVRGFPGPSAERSSEPVSYTHLT